MRAKCTNPGPLVIDIEHISIGGSPGALHNNVPMLAQLADWAHEAVPGKVVGYYGTNTLSSIPSAEHTLALELASHVDAFFTPIYNFDDIRANWEKRAQAAQAEARALDAKKPIYFFLWPQYHVGSARALRYVLGDYWRFQLETSRHYANGGAVGSRQICLGRPDRVVGGNAAICGFLASRERHGAVKRTAGARTRKPTITNSGDAHHFLL